MSINIGPLYPDDTYGYLIKVDNGLTTTLKPVSDGTGTDSPLSLSSADVKVASDLTLADVAEPDAPVGGVSVFSQAGVLKYKNPAGAVVDLGGGGVSDGDKGDVTVASSGTAWTVNTASVTLAKLQTVASDKLLGRASAGTGAVELVDCTAAGRAVLAAASAAAQRTALGLGSLATQSGTFSGSSSGTNTGDQNTYRNFAVSGQTTLSAGATSDTLTVAAGSNVTLTTTPGTNTLTIAAATSPGVSDGDKGDVTVASSGTAWTVKNDVVTYAKMQNVPADRLLGRATAGTGDVEEIPCTAAGRAVLAAASAAAQRTALGLGSLATQSGTFSGTASGTNTGDQNVFANLAVSGQSTVTAAATGDTLTFANGSGIAVTTNAGTKTVTVATTPDVQRTPPDTTPSTPTAITNAEPNHTYQCVSAVVVNATDNRLVPVRVFGSGANPLLLPHLRTYAEIDKRVPDASLSGGQAFQLFGSTGPLFNTAYTASLAVDGRAGKTWTVTTRRRNPADLYAPAFWLDPGAVLGDYPTTFEGADQDAAEDGDAVRSFWSRSALGLHMQQATAGQRPAQQTSGGKKILQFGGGHRMTNDTAHFADFRPPPYTGAILNPYFAVAFKWVESGSTGYGRVFSMVVGTADDAGGGSANAVILRRNGEGAGTRLSLDIAGATVATGFAPPGGFQLVEIFRTGTLVKVLVGGTEVASVTASFNVTPTTLTLGGRASANDAGLVMDLAGFVYRPVYDAGYATVVRDYFLNERLPA